MCFGSSGPNYSSNNFTATFPVSFNGILSIVLGQVALTAADAVTNTWDVSIGWVTVTQLGLWARWGNTPGYYYLVLGY